MKKSIFTKYASFFIILLSFLFCSFSLTAKEVLWSGFKPLIYEGEKGPGKGKHIVFIASDHEYRSEQTCPAIARILSKRYGFKCTVLFGMNKKSGAIHPGSSFVPGMDVLKEADLLFCFMRFLDLPEKDMDQFVNYLKRGGPVIGLRTTTHAFNIKKGKYNKYTYNNKTEDFLLGFGRQVLGETWAGHHGKNHVSSTRLTPVEEQANHPVNRGVAVAHMQSAGYKANPMPNSIILSMAQPLATMGKDSALHESLKSVPTSWVRTYQIQDGKEGKAFCSTHGASQDIQDENYRRQLINAVFWGMGMENQIDAKMNIDFVGRYIPAVFGWDFRKDAMVDEIRGWDSAIWPDKKKLDKAFPDNAVLNGSFEAGGKNLSYWETGASISLSEGISKSGKRSMRLSSRVGNESLHQSVNIEPDTNYLLSFWVNIEEGSSGSVVFDTGDLFDAPNQGQFLIGDSVAGKGWKRFIGGFNSANEKSVVLRMFPRSDFKGSAYFDDILLVPADSIRGNAKLNIEKGSSIVLLGNGLGSRMMNYGYFETEIYSRYPALNLKIRNICDEGNTAVFRPHAGRSRPWAFPGADKFSDRYFNEKESNGVGFFESPDEWLDKLDADVILAFFGFNESFAGKKGLEGYKNELRAFVRHTLFSKYNDKVPPQLVFVSPTAFQDLSNVYNTPTGKQQNKNLKLYTKAMKEVAGEYNVGFVDIFKPTAKLFKKVKRKGKGTEYTIDGALLNNDGYRKLAPILADRLFPKSKKVDLSEELYAAVLDKNWYWHNYYKMPNGVHAFGRRHMPYGPDNYPAEFEKLEQMLDNRDRLLWGLLQGERVDLSVLDAKTRKIPDIQTNYSKESLKNGEADYKYGDDALKALNVPDGYRIELFASEKEFSNLANPVQMSFDNKGRLWVAVMPSYPHYKPGDSKPNDMLLIYEDTDGDGKADKETVYADGLHLPIGFEFAPEGVYLMQAPYLILLKDTDGDDKADVREYLYGGFDDHDTHHAASAFCADPSGAFYLSEGVFLHSNIETAYGTLRANDGGFFRFDPRTRRMERTVRVHIPNPWGVAVDEWGQTFWADTSGPNVRWMLPASINMPYGQFAPKPKSIIEDAHRVRPTSGLEFVSSRHFPDDVQGDLLINNTIGFLGTKQHKMRDDGSGFLTSHRQDLIRGDDGNFRPVDMEFAPDGSLYVIDWHNVLIGHMQHNARDPLRDHSHGRIYRLTYPSRPLLKPAKVHGASIDELLDNLKLPEYRTRYRSRRELRSRPADDVMKALSRWVSKLDKEDARYEHHLTEALWLSWGVGRADKKLVKKLLGAKDYRARAAAVQVIRYSEGQMKNLSKLLSNAAEDDNARVRLAVLAAASYLAKDDAQAIAAKVGERELDQWMEKPYQAVKSVLEKGVYDEEAEKSNKKEVVSGHLSGKDRELYILGEKIYAKEGYCGTCHQEDGKGLPDSGFPPLAQSEWVTGDKERLIKLTLNGLMGPIEVNGVKYPGLVPMTPFRGLLNDEETAAVLTYSRNAFGNKAGVITPDEVKVVRDATKGKVGFYTPDELLKSDLASVGK